ncbi:hypothetical protein P389DRAFT_174032 [Cystobasidium minutum MCA 4210]|uniref:uncharacterized protein n=1 Tax=Cystobasidium minutum MCA 4210 TaxID=1397322 RepID=UPI0034CECA13|eukprot:jgi/Rhomi1/174032/fgenesh1_kg.7_\
MAAATVLPPRGGGARPSRSTRPLLVLALSVPAVYFAYAMNNRRHGVIEGKRAHQYSVTGQAHPGQDKAFEGHPPVERSGGGI